MSRFIATGSARSATERLRRRDRAPSELRRLLLSACVLGWLLSIASIAGATPLFTGLGDLPGGEFGSSAQEVSADGSTVVGWSYFDGSRTAPFRWTAAEGLRGLGGLPGGSPAGMAHDVSADGSVVVGGNAPVEVFRWTSSGGIVGLDVPGDGLGVSADGSTVVGYLRTALGDEAMMWTAEGGVARLGGPSGEDVRGQAQAVSEDGSAIVGWIASQQLGSVAFRWTEEGGTLSLGTLPGGGFSEASGITPDGSVVVGRARTSNPEVAEPFRWTEEGGMVGLGNLPGSRLASAFDVSADGNVIVGGAVIDGEVLSVAIVWDPVHGMRLLQEVLVEAGADLTGWHLVGATGISSDGQTIVGLGRNPTGQLEAWIAILPEPSASLLLALGLLAITAARRFGCEMRSERSSAEKPRAHGSLLMLLIVALSAVPHPLAAASFEGLHVMAAFGMSGDGSAVVGQGASTTSDAFRWTRAGGVGSLGDLPGALDHGGAVATSADGSVVVGFSSSARSTSNGTEAFRWTSGSGMIALGLFHIIARGLSADGSMVVGTSDTDEGLEAFLWTANSGMVGLGDLPGRGSLVSGCAVHPSGCSVAVEVAMRALLGLAVILAAAIAPLAVLAVPRFRKRVMCTQRRLPHPVLRRTRLLYGRRLRPASGLLSVLRRQRRPAHPVDVPGERPDRRHLRGEEIHIDGDLRIAIATATAAQGPVDGAQSEVRFR